MTADIWVNDHKLAVTTNLADGLRRFRSHDFPGPRMWYWIDAVCINQQDLPERGQQVAVMGHVYRSAVGVRVWLGEAGDSCERGLAILGIISSFRDSAGATTYVRERFLAREHARIERDIADLAQLGALP